MFNDPLIDGHENQADFYDEMQAEADSGLPQRWIGTKYCEKCDLIGRQFCRCNSIPTLDPILLAPASLTVDGLTYWHHRAQVLLGQSVTIVSQ